MTAPRQILPGCTYFVTRRCAQRQFLLRPSKQVNELFEYVLAVAAQRYGIRVHAYGVMSNHVHLVVTDPDARLPAFAQYLFAFIARAVNASLGRWEAFWAPGSYSAVKLASAADLVDKIAYVLANPVAAGLVRSTTEWPGAYSHPDGLAVAVIDVRRPAGFFADDGALPETARLELTLPPGFESADEFRSQVLAALRERESDAREEFGDRFLGARRVLRQNPFSRPTTTEPRRNLSPRVAARNPALRVEELRERKNFVRSYRLAWADRRAGNLDVKFPAGTYLLRVLHAVPCAAVA